ncbi:collagen alpha-1(I) chain-like [Vulpes lagopus]|uniref:collagen alpha-1(I) chain-like n=1 Tax=Vulpes lagopus TaxID=494514 RepID=UPI001BC8F211|nr:collagen alpha-1(I) chain-like [Vulpes lagopus]
MGPGPSRVSTGPVGPDGCGQKREGSRRHCGARRDEEWDVPPGLGRSPLVDRRVKAVAGCGRRVLPEVTGQLRLAMPAARRSRAKARTHWPLGPRPATRHPAGAPKQKPGCRVVPPAPRPGARARVRPTQGPEPGTALPESGCPPPPRGLLGHQGTGDARVGAGLAVAQQPGTRCPPPAWSACPQAGLLVRELASVLALLRGDPDAATVSLWRWRYPWQIVVTGVSGRLYGRTWAVHACRAQRCHSVKPWWWPRPPGDPTLGRLPWRASNGHLVSPRKPEGIAEPPSLQSEDCRVPTSAGSPRPGIPVATAHVGFTSRRPGPGCERYGTAAPPLPTNTVLRPDVPEAASGAPPAGSLVTPLGAQGSQRWDQRTPQPPPALRGFSAVIWGGACPSPLSFGSPSAAEGGLAFPPPPPGPPPQQLGAGRGRPTAPTVPRSCVWAKVDPYPGGQQSLHCPALRPPVWCPPSPWALGTQQRPGSSGGRNLVPAVTATWIPMRAGGPGPGPGKAGCKVPAVRQHRTGEPGPQLGQGAAAANCAARAAPQRAGAAAGDTDLCPGSGQDEEDTTRLGTLVGDPDPAYGKVQRGWRGSGGLGRGREEPRLARAAVTHRPGLLSGCDWREGPVAGAPGPPTWMRQVHGESAAVSEPRRLRFIGASGAGANPGSAPSEGPGELCCRRWHIITRLRSAVQLASGPDGGAPRGESGSAATLCDALGALGPSALFHPTLRFSSYSHLVTPCGARRTGAPAADRGGGLLGDAATPPAFSLFHPVRQLTHSPAQPALNPATPCEDPQATREAPSILAAGKPRDISSLRHARCSHTLLSTLPGNGGLQTQEVAAASAALCSPPDPVGPAPAVTSPRDVAGSTRRPLGGSAALPPGPAVSVGPANGRRRGGLPSVTGLVTPAGTGRRDWPGLEAGRVGSHGTAEAPLAPASRHTPSEGFCCVASRTPFGVRLPGCGSSSSTRAPPSKCSRNKVIAGVPPRQVGAQWPGSGHPRRRRRPPVAVDAPPPRALLIMPGPPCLLSAIHSPPECQAPALLTSSPPGSCRLSQAPGRPPPAFPAHPSCQARAAPGWPWS